jgi:dipeptidase E
MRAIVAIGGGAMRSAGRLAMHREIVHLSGKRRPKLLFVPTAGSDSEEYWEIGQKYLGSALGCQAEPLFLIRERPSTAEIKEKILGADIVYVPGGNTLKMMRLWRRLGVDRLLRTAYENGTVLAGVSAGSICWFESGHSDSMSYYNPKSWKYINVRGLGLLRGIHCPHYNSGTLGVARRKNFQAMIRKTGGLGIAIEDNCAIEFIDDKYYRILSSTPRAGAYRVYRNANKVVSERLKRSSSLFPMAELYRYTR